MTRHFIDFNGADEGVCRPRNKVAILSRFKSVLEDIDWLWNEWWLGQPDHLSEGHLRRGSVAIWQLLVDGLLQKAWRHYGFERQPRIFAPDVVSLADRDGLRLDLAPIVFAGGGRQDGKDMSFLGAFRVNNQTTCVPAEAEVGFAVEVRIIARLASDAPGPLDTLIEKPWNLNEYLESVGAVRRGKLIKRREVIEYFRNYVGGAHHDLLKDAQNSKRERYELIAELESRAWTFIRDGLHFELLSIGQAVARSEDVRALAERIRNDSSFLPNRPRPEADWRQ